MPQKQQLIGLRPWGTPSLYGWQDPKHPSFCKSSCGRSAPLPRGFLSQLLRRWSCILSSFKIILDGSAGLPLLLIPAWQWSLLLYALRVIRIIVYSCGSFISVEEWILFQGICIHPYYWWMLGHFHLDCYSQRCLVDKRAFLSSMC